MAGVTQILPSALLPDTDDDAQSQNILSILGRIYDERGPFRHLTEQSLEAELATERLQDSSSDGDDDDNDEAGESDEIDAKTQPDQLYARKMEMLSHLM